MEKVQEVYKGHAWTFGDDINTESIMPSHVNHDAKKAAEICLEYYDPEFPKKAQPGDFVVAGKNFGNSSSRPAASTFRAMQISAVICESAARIFDRSSWAMGIPVIQCEGISGFVNKGDEIEVNVVTGLIKNLTTKKEIQAKKTPAIQLEQFLRGTGGTVQWIKDHPEEYENVMIIK